MLSSDRQPGEIEALDERLIQRFAGGLVIDIAAPDFETRVAILRRQAEERRASFSPDVLETVAAIGANSVRELIGGLNRLIALQAVSESAIDAAQARAILGRGGGAEEPLGPAEAKPAPGRAGATGAEAPSDEFGAFLSDVVSTVVQQVEAWRSRVGEAILRWEGEGYRTTRLSALLEEESPSDPDMALQEFSKDIERLRLLQAEAVELDPALAGAAVFRDPDNVEDARLQVERARQGTLPPPAPAPVWQLADFVEGPGNLLALKAARNVIAEPGRVYNPLVIVGGSGVGKTHLLHGIGNELAKAPGSVVACLSAQDLIDDLIKAIDKNRVNWWRARYRRITALLLDDIHLIAGKDRTQEELFWLFNLLHEAARQMVFTSAVPLAQLTGIETRLLTRLEGGLVVELPLPEREVRRRHRRAPVAGQGGRGGSRTGRLPGRPAGRLGAGAAGLGAAGAQCRRHRAGAAHRRAGSAPARGCPRRAGAASSAGPDQRRAHAGGQPPQPREDRLGLARRGRSRHRGSALMAIKGSLKEASLPDVLQLLALGKKTGCLAVADRQNFGYIYFDEGRICYASIVNRRDRLGDLLVKSGRISPEQLKQAIQIQEERRDRKLGEILVDSGRHPARGARGLHATPDRRGGLLPVHLDLRARSTSRPGCGPSIRTSWSTSIPSRCCSKARAGWTSGASSRRRSPASI